VRKESEPANRQAGFICHCLDFCGPVVITFSHITRISILHHGPCLACLAYLQHSFLSTTPSPYYFLLVTFPSLDKMKLNLSQLLLLGLASTAIASTWFGKAGENAASFPETSVD
jgi:hypothetical protein